MTTPIDLAICSYLEPEHVERIRAVSKRLRVHYHPDLLPTPRYPADHVGKLAPRDPEGETAWQRMIECAEICFDVDYHDIEGFRERARNARWIQVSSAGIGGLVTRFGLDSVGAAFTTAAGVHARPLAEFALWSMLAFAKNYPRARRQQREHVWQRFHNDDLEGATLAVVGLGSIGREIARLVRPFGVRVVASKRTLDGVTAASQGVDELFGPGGLHAMLAQADYVCVVTPHTSETEGMFDRAAFAAMKPGAALINIGRGAVVDEGALLDALRGPDLAGAVLDVAPEEPLPPDHPLWDLENVILFPHSASTSKKENARLTELFCDNLERYLAGRPLRNVFELERNY